MKEKQKYIFIGALVVFLIGSILIYFVFGKSKKDNNEKFVSSLNQEVKLDISDESVDWNALPKEEIKLNDSLTINKAGVYYLNGTLENGSVTIDTKDNVKLVLNNTKINNNDGPAINVINAKTVLIYLEKDSENILSDGKKHKDQDLDGVIFSKDDLVFDGEGTLKIEANYQDAIVSKDDLKINKGNYVINAEDDGIRGSDSVYILDGNFTLNVGGDGLKATNDKDNKKGYVKIENGKFTIESDLDGIVAENKVIINNGEFNINTGGGSSNSSSSSPSWGMWGKNPLNSKNKASAKGIKAKDNIVINGGSFTLDTSDDSIHSNQNVGINGTLNISSGDDAIHADNELIIDGGVVEITKSYEGLEATQMTINNGNISLVASDDGINVAGGSDSSSKNRPGANQFKESSTSILKIYGGTIYVNASGDGIDVNGSIYIYSGEITVDGPSDNSNGALDYDSEFIMDGGTLLAVGSSGMLQGISNNSKQYNVTASLKEAYKEGQTVKIVSEDDMEIVKYTPQKSFKAIVVSSPKLEKGSNYKILVDDKEIESFTVSSITTAVGNVHENPMGGGGKNPNGIPKDNQGNKRPPKR